MKKFWLLAVAVLILAGIGGTCFLLSNLDALVARVIEEQGSEVVGTAVAVSGVEIALREGRGTIAGLSIASPDGYRARHAFTLGEITLDIGLDSVTEDPLVVEEIRVRAPVVRAEFLADGSSNIRDLQQNVQGYAARFAGDGDGGGDGNDGGDTTADMKRLRIERFVFEEGRVAVDAAALGLEPRELALPAIRLDGIGGAGGARPDALAQAVLRALTDQAVAAARAEVERQVKGAVEDEATKQATGLLDRITN